MNTIVRLFLPGLPQEPLRLEIDKPTKIKIITRYLATPKNAINLSDHIIIKSPGVELDYDCFGVLAENAEKTLKFTLDFSGYETNSIGREREEVLLLGRPRKNLSSPTILCSDPTVSGSHGVTFGAVSENHLAYLCSRGLSDQAAKKMLILGRFRETLMLAQSSTSSDNNLMDQFETLLNEVLS